MENIRKIAIMAIAVSCSGQPREQMDQKGGLGGSYMNEAHAAPADAGGGGDTQPEMPWNAVHRSFRMKRVPEVLLNFLSVHKYPWAVTNEGDWTIVTLFIPQGVVISITLTPMDEYGKPLGDPTLYTLGDDGKLGTYTMQDGETSKELNFGDSSEQVLQIGANTLSVPSSEQFVGGSTCHVAQGVFTSECDMTYRVSWMGCDELRSFHDGPAECHDEPFGIFLRAGEEAGFYPVTPGDEPVHIYVEPQEE